MGTAAVPLLPRDVFGLLQQAQAGLASPAPPRTLNPHQDATVTALAEWIIPQTDTPGAKAVRVNEFIDLILTEWMDDHERSLFLAGLGDVDKRSQAQFGRNFVDCAEGQQKQMLIAFDEEQTTLRQAEIHAWHRRRQMGVAAEESFFRTMKQLTLVGYFTAEVGAKQALHYEVIPSSHTQCAPLPEEEEAAK